MIKHGSLLGGILLIAGTSIGGGILALPVLTSLGGFIPSLAIYLLCWLFMASTGLLLLEVCHWMEGETNIVSMAEKTLGVTGKAFAWLIYLFLFYCLTLAYIVGCGNLVSQALPISDWTGSILFVILFAPFVFLGSKAVGRINALLMVGLFISYFLFVYIGLPFVDYDNLKPMNWSLSLYALPIAFTSFAFQGIIPTLSNYLDHDLKKTRLAILVGSFIPLVAYVIWEWLILGITGQKGLAEALAHGDNAVQPLKAFTQNPNVYLIGQYFAFFALATSFFGVTLGLLDFLADGLKMKKTNRGKLFLSILVFVPPLLVALWNPHLFLKALDLAGGYGCALLLGVLPILMVWSGRYSKNFNTKRVFPGGKIALALLMCFVLFEIIFETIHLLGIPK